MRASQPRIPLLVLLAAATLLACDSGTDEAQTGEVATTTTFIGDVDETTAMVGLIQDGDQVSAYVCGREDTLQTHTRWFHGTLSEDGISVSMEAEGWHLEGALTAEVFDGVLSDPDGEPASISIDASSADAMTGLYSVLDAGCRAGLLVLEADTLVTQGAWCDGDGLVKQVTPMMPVALIDGGIAVMVDDTDPAVSLTMSQHTP